MIRIVLGNVGSGKTAMIVREMLHSRRQTYSNIITKKIKNNNLLDSDMIITKEVVKVKKNGDPVFKKKLNVDFWRNLSRDKSLNVVLDEAHTLMNPRRSMSETNKILTDFLALLRRVLGGSDAGNGELILITQLERRLDVIAKEMATKIQKCKCYYIKRCKKCGIGFAENNETPEKWVYCPTCDVTLHKENFIIEVLNFINIDAYNMYNLYGMKTYYDKYYITDIEKYFKYYDTLQWDNLITDD